VAFATWMLGHIFLALNLRSDHTPLLKQGLLTNKNMLIWAIIALVVLVLAISTPFIQTSLQITELNLQSWVMVILVAFISTFWMEIKKSLGK
jgi:Ca2+-transporting ATPase